VNVPLAAPFQRAVDRPLRNLDLVHVVPPRVL
jgi:hypothetical protein